MSVLSRLFILRKTDLLIAAFNGGWCQRLATLDNGENRRPGKNVTALPTPRWNAMTLVVVDDETKYVYI